MKLTSCCLRPRNLNKSFSSDISLHCPSLFDYSNSTTYYLSTNTQIYALKINLQLCFHFGSQAKCEPWPLRQNHQQYTTYLMWRSCTNKAKIKPNLCRKSGDLGRGWVASTKEGRHRERTIQMHCSANDWCSHYLHHYQTFIYRIVLNS